LRAAVAMSGLPFLPGNSANFNIGKTRFHKSQKLVFHNSVAQIDTTKPGIGGSPSAKLDFKMTAYPLQPGQAAQPAWLAFDRQVLRFFGHFQESVEETNGENFRLRYCTILFYLEDDTFQVNEKATDNSGLNQGTLIRRHRVPKPAPNDDKFYTVEELNVGQEITLYGRTFLLTSCDDFTADFITKLGIRVGDSLDVPIDSHTTKLQETQSQKHPLRPYEKIDTLRQFLEHDRQVLRFYCLWDDTRSMFGDKRYMVLHYFLADDEIEVMEVLPSNSGRDGTGMFYRKAKLAKDVAALSKLPGAKTPRTVLNVFSQGITDNKSRNILDSLRTGSAEDDYYTDADLSIGTSIQLLGREILICDCDAFTQAHYANKYGVTDFSPINVEEPAAPPPQRPPPPPTGYGTEDDSMVSVNRLVLQPPKKFPGAYLPSRAEDVEGGNVLRFFARLNSSDPLHVDRRFIVSYYLVDDSVAIYEKQFRNSGMRGGKFLERGKYPTADGSRNYGAHDLFKGAQLKFNAHTFTLIYADEYTMSFMEKYSFPFSSPDAALDKLSTASGAVKAALKKRPAEDGTMEGSRVRDILLGAGAINEQEVETVIRTFSTTDGRVDFGGFLARIGA